MGLTPRARKMLGWAKQNGGRFRFAGIIEGDAADELERGGLVEVKNDYPPNLAYPGRSGVIEIRDEEEETDAASA